MLSPLTQCTRTSSDSSDKVSSNTGKKVSTYWNVRLGTLVSMWLSHSRAATFVPKFPSFRMWQMTPITSSTSSLQGLKCQSSFKTIISCMILLTYQYQYLLFTSTSMIYYLPKDVASSCRVLYDLNIFYCIYTYTKGLNTSSYNLLGSHLKSIICQLMIVNFLKNLLFKDLFLQKSHR